MNKKTEAIILANQKGYKVTKDGKVINKYNKQLFTNNMNGYFFLCVRINTEKSINIAVHRLQAFQKFGEEIFKEKIEVRHLNGNSTDNSYDNIVIGSHYENMMDIPKEKRILNSSNPIYCHKSIIEDRKNGLTYKELCIKYNIKSKGTINFIINNSLLSKK